MWPSSQTTIKDRRKFSTGLQERPTPSLCSFVLDVAIPNKLRVPRIGWDKGGEYTVDYFRQYVSFAGP